MQLLGELRKIRGNPYIVVASLAANLLGLALPLAMIQVYDRIIPRQGFETLTVLALGLCLAALADLLIRLARGHLIAIAGRRFEAQAYDLAFQYILRPGTPISALDKGGLNERLGALERLRRHHGSEAATAMLDLPFIAVFLIVMTMISPILGLAVMGFALMSLVSIWLHRIYILSLTQSRQERDSRRHSFLVETLEGVEMIKSLGVEALMQRRYERLMSVSAKITRDLSALVSFTQGVTSTLSLTAPAFVSSVGAFLVIRGEMSVGALAAAVLLTSRVIQPTLKIEALFAGERDIQQSEADAEELIGVDLRRNQSVELDTVDELRLEGVDIGVDPEKPPSLRDVSLTLRRGDCALINGADGSGRTLLLSVIAGHLPALKGEVQINGAPIADIFTSDLSERISFLSPDYTMLEGSLLENLTNFDVERNQDTAFALAEELGIENYISRHSDGLSMRVAAHVASSLPNSIHQGVMLISGLLRYPDVILFDEANFGLDHRVDKNLLEMMRRRAPDAIVLLVTRRPSYMQIANRVFEIKGDELVEMPLPKKNPEAVAV